MAGFAGFAYPDRFPNLPSLSQSDREALNEWWGNFLNELHRRDTGSFNGAANGKPFYVITGTSINRTLNFATVSTVAGLATFVGTLAADLSSKGLIA